MKTNTSILFLIFNRPEETRRVFEAIRSVKPAKLFIAADGPRARLPDEISLCEKTREIVSLVDWPCEVITRFQENNLGCRKHVSSSIDWFFEQVEEGMIIEDDCLPDQSFFSFANVMLKKYREDEKVMHISGANFQYGNMRGRSGSKDVPPSYYFSHCPHIWGWATWRRAWKAYDVEMSDLDTCIRSKKIYPLFQDAKVARFWISLFRHIKEKNIDTWDAQWAYALMRSEGLAVTPNINLVENIGFGTDSTHTENKDDVKRQPAVSLGTISHPQNIEADLEADDFLAKTIYIEPFWKKLFRKLKLR